MLKRLALIALILGCDVSDGAPTAGTISDPAVRKIDTLLLTLDLRLDALSLAPGQVEWVELEVDGRPWGRYAPDAVEPGGEVDQDGWRLNHRPDPEVIVAAAEREMQRADAPPGDVAGWASALAHALDAGDHLARLRTVRLKRDDGEVVELEPNLLIPFTAQPGASSALIGEIELPISKSEVTQ